MLDWRSREADQNPLPSEVRASVGATSVLSSMRKPGWDSEIVTGTLGTTALERTLRVVLVMIPVTAMAFLLGADLRGDRQVLGEADEGGHRRGEGRVAHRGQVVPVEGDGRGQGAHAGLYRSPEPSFDDVG